MRACVRACVRECVSACVPACVSFRLQLRTREHRMSSFTRRGDNSAAAALASTPISFRFNSGSDAVLDFDPGPAF
ncbi:hypothetical protein EVAR_18775_1 [Eumeta japonica]|uniref:Uncharacterized protein n=1 Tax=Eumeta variegata TaxID=151549 RepID=A0A4C1UN42_EUMVA|nr:hypothetical protein EVAR_18775_1 [Eumeta japonica]